MEDEDEVLEALDKRLMQEVVITANEFGFMRGRSTTVAIFALRSVLETYRGGRQDIHVVFLHQEKMFDRIPEQVIWWSMKKYDRVTTIVRSIRGEMEEFSMRVGVHHGSALNSFLFSMATDTISEDLH
ncbi:unnamed protein product [Soboliphyme baturini]|uniref:Reverse transcriptase domain-containing protein n=1 Tax=Soboliphyme baturini TaxID=241478 RepID=A0A183IBB7_9BILA|nr:unnamed protein product [Soboliphyme baturini]